MHMWNVDSNCPELYVLIRCVLSGPVDHYNNVKPSLVLLSYFDSCTAIVCSAHALGVVNGVASFITLDEQFQ